MIQKFQDLFESKLKVGQTLKSTKESSGVFGGRSGKIIKIQGDQITVDFGKGDTYGVSLRRIDTKTMTIDKD